MDSFDRIVNWRAPVSASLNVNWISLYERVPQGWNALEQPKDHIEVVQFSTLFVIGVTGVSPKFVAAIP